MTETNTKRAIKGKRKVLMFRLLTERATKKASRLMFQINHTIKEEPKTESIQTKDGAQPSSGGLETTVELEVLQSDSETMDMLHYANNKGQEVEVWEIDFDKPHETDQNKYKARYGFGLLTGWESEAAVEGNATAKPSIIISGELVDGYATVSEEQVEEAKLWFYDTTMNPTKTEPIPLYPTGNNTATHNIPDVPRA